MEISNELLEFLAPLLGKSAGELSEAVEKDDEGKFKLESAKAVISELQKERLKSVESAARNEGHGRATREVLSAKEKELAEKYKVEGSTIEEIIQAAIENSSEGEELTPEKIRESEIYQQDLKALKSAKEEAESQFQEFKQTVEQRQVDHKLNDKLQSFLQGEGFVLPKDERRKKALFDAYKARLKDGRQFQFKDDQVAVLDKDGNPIKDDLHNVRSFDEVAGEFAGLFFDKQQSTGKESPGAGGQPPGNPGDDLPEITSSQDYYDNIKKLPADKRGAYLEKFRKFQEQAS